MIINTCREIITSFINI